MGKGGAKYETEILNEIQILLNQQNGVISQAQIIKIIQKYYSQLYSESSCFNKIERALTRQNIVKSVKVNIGNLPAQKFSKIPQINQFLSLYISPSVPDDKKKSLIASFIRNTIPNLEMPSIKRTISKELFIEQTLQPRKRPETMEFPSIQFRAMLLHQFLLSTFKASPFSLEMISNTIPVYLSAQIIRSYEVKPIVLPIICPLEISYQFEIDLLVPYLRPPFHVLIQKIDSVYNSIIPTAIIEIPFFNISKKYDFFNDPSAFSDYWLLIFSLGNEKFRQFPTSISTRFEKFISLYCEKLSINLIPFFPYQIERLSEKIGVTPSILSYAIQKIFKRKLRALQCSKESFLESKLFPLNGFITFLITKTSFLKTSDPKFANSLSTPFKVDGSLESLAKVYAASQLTEEGYVINQRSNFKLFKKQVKKWVSQCSKFSNFFSSMKESQVFSSLVRHEMALLIEEMKYPSFFYDRIGIEPIKTVIFGLDDGENDNEINDDNLNYNNDENSNDDENSNENDNGNENYINVMRSNSANFHSESFKQVDRILHSPSFQSMEISTSKPKLSELNEIFTKSFPDFTKEKFFEEPKNVNENTSSKSTNDDDENDKYFDEGDGVFPTAYAIDSPVNSDASNDEVLEPPQISNESTEEEKYEKENSEENLFTNYGIDDEDEDEIIEYPRLNQSDFHEATENEFLSLFELKKRIIDADVSVSVAIEFLKIILATPANPSTNDLKLRQSVHFSQKDALNAIWLLSSIDIYKREKILKFPENKWKFSLPEKSFPSPQFIPFCDNPTKDDPSPLKIVWNQTPIIDNNDDANEDDEDDDSDDDEIIGEDDDNDGNKNYQEYITFHFRNETFKQQLNAYKKLKHTFNFERQRYKLPLLPSFDTNESSSSNHDVDQPQLADQLYNSDPLGQFCFGQYESDIPNLEDLPCRFIVNIVNASGVYGIDLTDIIHSFGSPILQSDNIISNVLLLCSMDFICRVPSSRLVPRYTRFIPCNTICKPISHKIELVSPHIWTNFDGFINIDVKMNLMKNIATYIFAHEFCDFLDLIGEFPYVSPYDLCLLLQMLECDEIIFSQYFQVIKPDILEDEVTIPVPPLDPFEKFLIVLDNQRKNIINDVFYKRILRTNREMLPNLCILNNL